MAVTNSTDVVVKPDDEVSSDVTAPITGKAVDAPQDKSELKESAAPRIKQRRIQRFFRRFFGVGAGVWIGLLIVGGGFGMLAYTWGKTADLLDVALQVPYIVSGGLVGLGLILFGLMVVNVSVKRRDAIERQRQLEELREALAGLRASIEGDGEDKSE